MVGRKVDIVEDLLVFSLICWAIELVEEYSPSLYEGIGGVGVFIVSHSSPIFFICVAAFSSLPCSFSQLRHSL